MAIYNSGNPDEKTTMTLTTRDLWLLDLCLDLVDRHHTKDSSLRLDLQSLRDKLSHESGGTNDPG